MQHNLNPSYRAAAMSMLFAPITVLLIVAHLNPVNGRPHSKDHPHPEPDKKDYSWTEADGYEECDEFLEYRKNAKSIKPLNEICERLESYNDESDDAAYGCIPYKELNSSGCGYAKRILPRGNWTTTYMDRTTPRGYRQAYMRLHGYRSGNKNPLKESVGMFVPVMKEWRKDSDNKFERATMSFYIPERYQKNPPVSSDPAVIVEEWPDMEIYIRAFGGSRNDTDQLSQQFDRLKVALAKENITTVSDLRMTAGYGHRIEVILFGLPETGEDYRPLKELDESVFGLESA